MMQSSVGAKLDELRAEVALYARRRQRGRAAFLQTVIDEIAQAEAEDRKELLTRDEALAYSGYSRTHFQELELQGVICSLDEHGPKRYRRDELPRRPSSLTRFRDRPAGSRKGAVEAKKDRRAEEIRQSAREMALSIASN
jgi:hypothetical protein